MEGRLLLNNARGRPASEGDRNWHRGGVGSSQPPRDPTLRLRHYRPPARTGGKSGGCWSPIAVKESDARLTRIERTTDQQRGHAEAGSCARRRACRSLKAFTPASVESSAAIAAAIMRAALFPVIPAI